MILRKGQMEALDEARLPEFENAMVEHLREFTPLHSESLGESGIRSLVRLGMERARKHRFTRRGPVRFYIESMILLGVDFDTDPQYPWPGEILRDSTIQDQMQRADRVHEWVMDLLDRVGGPDRMYAKRALRRARSIPFESIPVSSRDFTDQILVRLAENHPEKVDYLGAANLKGLVPRAIEESRDYAASTDAGVCLFIGLMFALGHGCAHDPKYPWIDHTLRNPAITDPDKRVGRLYSKAMTYLDHALEHLAVP